MKICQIKYYTGFLNSILWKKIWTLNPNAQIVSSILDRIKKNIPLILFKQRIERHHCESKVQVFGEYLEIKYTIPIIFYSTAKSKEPFEELNIEEAKLNKLEYIMHNTEVNILIVNTRINFTNE